MKLFHWKSQRIDFLVMAKDQSEARNILLNNVRSCYWQNPDRFDLVLRDLSLPAYFVADAGHVIAIDSEVKP